MTRGAPKRRPGACCPSSRSVGRTTDSKVREASAQLWLEGEQPPVHVAPDGAQLREVAQGAADGDARGFFLF